MRFATVGEWSYDPDHPALVYAEGWQTWSPVGWFRLGDAPDNAASERDQKVMLRPDKPAPPGVIQAQGVLAIGHRQGPARVWFAPHPDVEVPTLRVELQGGKAIVTADGAVESVDADDLFTALFRVGDRLRAPSLRPMPTGWCSWSYYFKQVTEKDVAENVEAAKRLALPIDVVQVDDGYETMVGDWLDIDPRFGSLRDAAHAIRSAGMVPGIWVAPFMVDPRSRLAAAHPHWLVPDATAGEHWDVEMRILDVTDFDAAAYLRHVFRTFLDWGFGFFKLDFLYAGAMHGIERYREAMNLIREAIGPDAILLIGGAPLLPSIGLCDAMRVGPDVLPEATDPQIDIDNVILAKWSRAWMHRRLWANDPDHVVARKEIKERYKWAAYVKSYRGVTFSGDRLSELDEFGLELTRRALSSRA